jgi:hypothetical protein
VCSWNLCGEFRLITSRYWHAGYTNCVESRVFPCFHRLEAVVFMKIIEIGVVHWFHTGTVRLNQL